MNLQFPTSNLIHPISNLQYPGRVALQQRVLPTYRAPFFDLLARSCQDGLSVFAGPPLDVEGIPSVASLDVAHLTRAENRHFSDPSSKFYLCWQKRIVQWLEETDPDVLILEANLRYPSNRRAIRWMKKRGRPILGWGLGAPPLGGMLAPIRRRSRSAYLRLLDGLIAYSQTGAAQYRNMGMPASQVFVAINATKPRPSGNLPNRSQSAAHPLTILFAGRLQERKRLDVLFAACAALPNEIQPRVVIVGDGPARTHFEEIATQIYPKTEFVGPKYGDEIQPYFERADLFALPGTGGLAVQQAMSYGLPVIVATGDGTQDDLVRPGNGWLVPPGDQQAFTEALRDALGNIPRLRQMGAESYRIVDDEVNIESMVSSFVKALRAVKGI